ncbi:hypothetical protein RAA17_14300 [Komagataeibacter rhaeticus]|nr:hypothetical protein [Komagataeibacter rhaeticus]
MRDHYRELRASVMEQIHGNRAQADSLAAPTSGRAMEMLYQPLLWLTDRMRLCYGEYGLLALYRMACRFSHVLTGGLCIGGQDYVGLDAMGLALQWPPYFPGTEGEIAQLAQGLGQAVQGVPVTPECLRPVCRACGRARPAWRMGAHQYRQPDLIFIITE